MAKRKRTPPPCDGTVEILFGLAGLITLSVLAVELMVHLDGDWFAETLAVIFGLVLARHHYRCHRGEPVAVPTEELIP